MKIEGIRLIESILTQLSFTSYIYKPTGTKLAAVTITTFLEDEVLAVHLNSHAFNDLVDRINIIGFPNRTHATAFINSDIGSLIIRRILSQTDIPSDINIDKNIMQYTLGPTTPTGDKIKEREFKELTPTPR